ncbi:MAG: 30S ribosomal protein S4 [Verrucomicrobia bacterium]|nr:30S ribosomal protein S4 [Verrucomicrobiota bacterium]
MSRYRGPKNRIARRFSANLFGRARNPMLHKAHPPGMHGARRRKKSDFGIQLEEQQKLKAIYGMLTQKQFVNYFKAAAAQTEGKTTENFLLLLESRLDNFVYKMKLAPTIFAAQQLVSHGHILVNGKKVDIRSFQVRPGMVVSLKEKSRKIPTVIQSSENTQKETPQYMELRGPFEAKMATPPARDQIVFPLPINVDGICSLLAHTS